jgi:hypothetical protein
MICLVASNQRPVAPHARPAPVPGAARSRRGEGRQRWPQHPRRPGISPSPEWRRPGLRGSAAAQRRPVRTHPSPRTRMLPAHQPVFSRCGLARLRPPARKRRRGAAQRGRLSHRSAVPQRQPRHPPRPTTVAGASRRTRSHPLLAPRNLTLIVSGRYTQSVGPRRRRRRTYPRHCPELGLQRTQLQTSPVDEFGPASRWATSRLARRLNAPLGATAGNVP